MHLLPMAITLSVSGVALYIDLYYHKVFNWLTLPAIGIGLILGFIPGQGGWLSHLIGFGVGFGIFFIFYILRIIGGGDVKLMAGLGAIMGYPFILGLAFYSLIAGAFLGILEMAINRRVIRGIKNIFMFFKLGITPGTKPYIPRESLGKFPFAVSIFIGVIISFLTGGNIPLTGGRI